MNPEASIPPEDEALSHELIFFFSTESAVALTPAQREEILQRALTAGHTDACEQRLIDQLLGEAPVEDPQRWEEKLHQTRALKTFLQETEGQIAQLRAAMAPGPEHRLTPEQRKAIFTEGERLRVQRQPAAASLPKVVPFPVQSVPHRAAPALGRHRMIFAAAAAVACLCGSAWIWRHTHAPATKNPVATTTVVRIDSTTPAAKTSSSASLTVESQPPSPPTLAALDKEVPLPKIEPTGEIPRRFTTPATPSSPLAAPAAVQHPPLRLSAFSSTAGSLPWMPSRMSPEISLPGSVAETSFLLLRHALTREKRLPNPASIRTEEMVAYAASLAEEKVTHSGLKPQGQLEVARNPWDESRLLVRATLSTAPMTAALSPPRRLTFLLRWDSLSAANERAQLLFWSGLRALEDQWRPQDQMSLILWGEKNGVVMNSGAIKTPSEALSALNQPDLPVMMTRSEALDLAVSTALSQRTTESINHFIIATDGPLDFSSTGSSEEVLRQVLSKCQAANLTPQVVQLGLASQPATPTFAPPVIIDQIADAATQFQRHFLFSGSPLADSLTAQIQFDPSQVQSFRLLGFTDGGTTSKAPSTISSHWTSGQKVTLLFETTEAATVYARPLKPGTSIPLETAEEPAAVKPTQVTLRWKYRPTGAKTWSEESTTWSGTPSHWSEMSEAYRLSAAGAGLALRLTDSSASGIDFDLLTALSSSTLTTDDQPRRMEFVELIHTAQQLTPRSSR